MNYDNVEVAAAKESAIALYEQLTEGLRWQSSGRRQYALTRHYGGLLQCIEP